MAISVQDYVNAIQSFIPASQNLLSDNQFLIAINLARKQISQDFDPIINYTSFDLTEGTQEYDVATKTGISITKINKIFNVTITYGQVKYELKQTYKENLPLITFISLPTFYYLIRSGSTLTIGFYPQPQADLTATLKLSLAPTDLTSIGDTDNEIPDFLKELVIILSCHHVSNMISNADLATYYWNWYIQKRQTIRSHVI
jgi:hypothetical protein